MKFWDTDVPVKWAWRLITFWRQQYFTLLLWSDCLWQSVLDNVRIRVRPYLFHENLVIIVVHFLILDLLQELGGGVAEGGHDGPHLPEPLGDIGHHGAAVSRAGDLIVQGARLSVNVAVLKVRWYFLNLDIKFGLKMLCHDTEWSWKTRNEATLENTICKNVPSRAAENDGERILSI